MIYGKYSFFGRFKSEAVLPRYKGSTFRGVFGQALKKVVCALKNQEYEQCLLKQRCVYAQVFETQALSGEEKDKRIAARPHPYVIEPPLSTATSFVNNDPFNFDLLLFGDINNSLAYFIYAFEQMGNIGIGKRINGKRGRFSLEEVRCGDTLLYSWSDSILRNESNNKIMKLAAPQYLGHGRLSLHLITPLRLKFENRLRAELPFHVLVRAMLRRVSSLFSCYGEGEPDLDYREMVKRAQDVKIVNSGLEWYDWRRYSFRQDKSMLMGGMSGTVTYEGDIGEYLPLVDICSEVHIGKQTSFGLGKIKAEVFE